MKINIAVPYIDPLHFERRTSIVGGPSRGEDFQKSVDLIKRKIK